jgi:hypothetical protein
MAVVIDPLTTKSAPSMDSHVSGSIGISPRGISCAMAMVNNGARAITALTLEASRCAIASAKHP